MSEDDHDLWRGFLQPNESLIWNGRPSTRFRFVGINRRTFAPALTAAAACFSFAGFLRWVDPYGNPDFPYDPKLLDGFSNVLFALGLVFSIALPVLLDNFARRGLRYALTDRRALSLRKIAGDWSLEGVRLSPHMPVQLTDGPIPSINLFKDSEQEARNEPEFSFVGPPDPVDLLGTVFATVMGSGAGQTGQSEFQ